MRRRLSRRIRLNMPQLLRLRKLLVRWEKGGLNHDSCSTFCCDELRCATSSDWLVYAMRYEVLIGLPCLDFSLYFTDFNIGFQSPLYPRHSSKHRLHHLGLGSQF